MNSSNLCLPCTLPLCRLLYTGEDRVICILRFISTCLFVESSPWGADYLFLTAIQNLLHLKQEFKVQVINLSSSAILCLFEHYYS
ncbi:hypothetical protein E1A91_D09G172400v1 [Gossypium mustelinum]|uniref:Uncharacterized protein n=2 Tax=Gossypium TaxID=3633 RepID=A0A5D2TLW5_GOSMU|nr:hypothetical protein ES288_D09G182800v1 [Gossypium darwinii]TYI65676.1 hypothetical protein E1A91_D09G172400v1 [Gossypium mustelinum]